MPTCSDDRRSVAAKTILEATKWLTARATDTAEVTECPAEFSVSRTGSSSVVAIVEGVRVWLFPFLILNSHLIILGRFRSRPDVQLSTSWTKELLLLLPQTFSPEMLMDFASALPFCKSFLL